MWFLVWLGIAVAAESKGGGLEPILKAMNTVSGLLNVITNVLFRGFLSLMMLLIAGCIVRVFWEDCLSKLF